MPSDINLSSYRDTLHQGVRRFRSEVFPPRRERYEEAARGPQKPHTLFITCSDSRIDPELVTQSGPGEIFVTRNIGNVVPAYGETSSAVAAVVEYAIAALQVKQIVVCGHSDCGAMKGLLKRDSLASFPAVDNWLHNADTAWTIARAKNDDSLPAVTKENVLLQLNHLRTHPVVAGGLAAGTLAVYGWVYDIGSGTVSEYNPSANQFTTI